MVGPGAFFLPPTFQQQSQEIDVAIINFTRIVALNGQWNAEVSEEIDEVLRLVKKCLDSESATGFFLTVAMDPPSNKKIWCSRQLAETMVSVAEQQIDTLAQARAAAAAQAAAGGQRIAIPMH